ncbi:MAG: stage 0 sporulation family protein [Vulcanimicrobiota bacterium]
MPVLIGVSFKRAGKVYLFDPGTIELAMGDMVVVETARGRELGRVCTKPQNVEESEVVSPLKTVMRKATEEDSDTFFQNRLKSTEAFRICNDKIQEHNLPMKLIDVEYTLDSSKAIFYFSAEGRIDFRNLVRDLASVFKKRIELHQIGVRDEAKLIGGLGPCGRPVCCASFMTEFDPVSIKMAKEQNLSLNPERISGTCGRLMCCLKHEHVFYHETLKELPDLGSTIELPEGKATVVELSVPKRCVIVELANNVRVELPVEKLPPRKSHRRGRDETCEKCEKHGSREHIEVNGAPNGVSDDTQAIIEPEQSPASPPEEDRNADEGR